PTLFTSMLPPPPRPTLFPYTTLFRSEQAVAQIVSTGDSPEVKLQKIYAKTQSIRNTSYEVEKTEQEQKRAKEKEVNNVEDVWKRSEEHTSELQSLRHLVCRLLLEKKK